MSEMKVVLTGQVTGSRNGVAWPAPGTEVTLPQDEAYGLVNSGMARPVDSRNDDVEKRNRAAAAAAEAGVDDATKAAVAAATTTRARSARSKRAHEPANLGSAALEQPDELDNGPQLPEVNAEDSAKVEDPAEDTSSLDGPTGDTKEVTPDPSTEVGGSQDLTANTGQDQDSKPPAKKSAPSKSDK
jgi:hypothetical protein